MITTDNDNGAGKPNKSNLTTLRREKLSVLGNFKDAVGGGTSDNLRKIHELNY